MFLDCRELFNGMLAGDKKVDFDEFVVFMVFCFFDGNGNSEWTTLPRGVVATCA